MLSGRRVVGTGIVQFFPTPVSERVDSFIQIYGLAANSGAVYVGNTSNVTANSNDSTDGYPINAGKEVIITERDPNQLYLVADSGSQTIHWMIN